MRLGLSDETETGLTFICDSDFLCEMLIYRRYAPDASIVSLIEQPPNAAIEGSAARGWQKLRGYAAEYRKPPRRLAAVSPSGKPFAPDFQQPTKLRIPTHSARTAKFVKTDL